MNPENHKLFDGYIRVSQVAGREGDSFLSPKIQRETIERLAAFNGITLGEVVEEKDVSGGKKARDRELGRLVEKVEAGESDGLIVWKLTRFSRNMLDSIETAMRITDAGGRLLADDFDTANSYFKPFLGLLAGMAEEELDARREGWRVVKVNRVVEGGIHISANVPLGYKRGDGGVNPRTGRRIPAPLEKNPETAWVVPELFRRRAAGDSWESLRQWLVGNDVPTVKGAPWSSAVLLGVIRNRVYLGEARGAGPDHVRKDAHPPLVDEKTWQAAQGRRRRSTSSRENLALLRGLVRCGGCRYVMQARPAIGARGAIYVCNSRVGCPDPANITSEGVNGRIGLDNVVVDKVREWERAREDRIVFEGFDPSVDVEAIDQEIAALEAKREEDALDPEFARAMGDGRYAALAAYTARIKELKTERAELLREMGGPGRGPFREFWEEWDKPSMTIDRKRDHLASVIQAVFVNPSTRRGAPLKDEALRRRWFADRVQIVWVNDPVLAEIPRHGPGGGYEIAPWPFADATDTNVDVLGIDVSQVAVEDAAETVG